MFISIHYRYFKSLSFEASASIVPVWLACYYNPEFKTLQSPFLYQLISQMIQSCWGRHPFYRTFMSSKSKSHINILSIALARHMITRLCHNFAHATAAQLSWHVQNYDMIGSFEIKSKQKRISVKFQLWAHKLFVTKIPGIIRSWPGAAILQRGSAWATTSHLHKDASSHRRTGVGGGSQWMGR